jgi:hypothetical protein
VTLLTFIRFHIRFGFFRFSFQSFSFLQFQFRFSFHYFFVSVLALVNEFINFSFSAVFFFVNENHTGVWYHLAAKTTFGLILQGKNRLKHVNGER